LVKNVCVYCGSSTGSDPEFAEAARTLGTLLAAEGIRLVYGGAAVGLMGIVADAVLDAGGEVAGVIPRGLFRSEVPHQRLTEMIEVGSMHERKKCMSELADAFVALPGGLGTLEELAEIATWAQIGLHHKPIATLDINGYWAPFHEFLRTAVGNGLMRPENLDLIVNVASVGELLPALRDYAAPLVPKWLDLDEV
jgi:uncharacterized protein (TIGR00730 family)